MTLSHVVGDGMSALRLMRSIACAYAGIQDAIDGPDPLAARELFFDDGGSLSAARLDQLLKVLKLRREPLSASTTSRFVTLGGKPGPLDPYFRAFCFMRLDSHETRSVLVQRRAPATINDLLIASFALAVCRWNRAHAVAPGPINVQSALNLRPREWFTEIVSNLAKDIKIAVPESAQHDLVAAQLAIAEQTVDIKRRRATGRVSVVGPLNLLPRSLRHAAVKTLQKRSHITHAGGLSNLGVVRTFPDLGHDAGRVTELWLSPPGIAGVGPLAGSLTHDGELFLTIHYRKAELTRAAAEAFAETWRDVLLGRA